MTQCERVVKYINDFGSITQYEAMMDLGIMRLASRICDLRKAGYRIGKASVKRRNRYGELKTVAKYWIEKDEDRID